MEGEPGFRPSQVHTARFIPFGATFNNTRAEVCAAFIVRTCHMRDDTWSAVGLLDVADRLRADAQAEIEPWASMVRNPFLRPDVRRLVADGFAEWVDEGEMPPVRFTTKGFEAMRKWVRG